MSSVRIGGSRRVVWWRGLTLGAVVCGVCLSSAAALIRSPSALRVEAPRLLSTPSPFASCPVPGSTGLNVEPSLSQDPSHADRLVAAWQQDVGGGARGIRVAHSTDAGASWRTTTLPRVSRCSGGSLQQITDVWLSTGLGGTVYAATLAFDLSGPGYGGVVQVSRSVDGGARWSAPVVVGTGTPTSALDKQVVTADSRIRGRAYMTWDDSLSLTSGTLFFARTTDGGRSWSHPKVLYEHPRGQAVLESQPISLTDGSLDVLFTREPPIHGPALPPALRRGTSTVFVVRSSDGGLHWSSPTRVTDIPITPTVDPETGKTIFAPMDFPSAASAGRTVALAWSEIPSQHRAAIRLMRSTDAGKHWSRALTVAKIRAQAFTPTVAVALNGTLAVTWYDLARDKLRDKPLSATWRFARSTDHGRTWRQQNLGLPFDLRRAAVSTGGSLRLGEYFGLTPVGPGFDAVRVTTTAGPSGPSRVESVRLMP